MADNEITQDAATEEQSSASSKVKIGEQEFAPEEIQEAVDALKNKRQWQTENTQRAQQLADYERQLQAREWTAQQQTAQMQQMQIQQQRVQNEQVELEKALTELEAVDPQHAKLIKLQQGALTEIQRRYSMLEQQNQALTGHIQTLAKVQSDAMLKGSIRDLKEKYPHCDEEVIQNAWLQGKYGSQLEEVAKRSHNRVEDRFQEYIKKKQKQGSKSVASPRGGAGMMTPPKPIKSLKDAEKAYRAFIRSKE